MLTNHKIKLQLKPIDSKLCFEMIVCMPLSREQTHHRKSGKNYRRGKVS